VAQASELTLNGDRDVAKQQCELQTARNMLIAPRHSTAREAVSMSTALPIMTDEVAQMPLKLCCFDCCCYAVPREAGEKVANLYFVHKACVSIFVLAPGWCEGAVPICRAILGPIFQSGSSETSHILVYPRGRREAFLRRRPE
jgi:hypothetical protein